MQEMYIQDKSKSGKKRMKAVKIIRAWTESDGRQLFLHHTGVYGYKDGSPVKKASELDIITDKIQHKLALRWWNSVGLKMSSQHYARETKKIEDLQMSGVPDAVVPGDVSDLDAVTYMRRPAAEQGTSAYSDPCTWYEWFPTRPEWWGQATVIEIAGYRYSMAVDVEEEEKRTEDEGLRTEVEGPGSEVRGQRSEVRGTEEVRGQRLEVKEQGQEQEQVTSDEGRETPQVAWKARDEKEEQEEFTTSDETATYETAHTAMVSELEQAHANAALDKLAQLTDALGVKFVVDNIKQVDDEEFSTLSRKVNKLAADLL